MGRLYEDFPEGVRYYGQGDRKRADTMSPHKYYITSKDVGKNALYDKNGNHILSLYTGPADTKG